MASGLPPPCSEIELIQPPVEEAVRSSSSRATSSRCDEGMSGRPASTAASDARVSGLWSSSGPGSATTSYATHHRHSCIGARAGFGDLLIGAGAMMIDANGLDAERHHHVRDAMVELIKIVEGFYACGVAASVYGKKDASGCAMPDAVYSNIGKLLLATQIYDMHRLAHYVSGGLLVSLPTPDEDHNPGAAAVINQAFAGRPGQSEGHRVALAHVMEDLTVSNQGGWYSVISLHGGGSPEAMKREIWRNYPVAEKTELIDTLMERGLLAGEAKAGAQPGKCCATGCRPPVMGERLFRGSEPT